MASTLSTEIGSVTLLGGVSTIDVSGTTLKIEAFCAVSVFKADAIKLITIFRSHFESSLLLSILPHVIRHLQSKHVVIQTYAAVCIEKFLTVKDKDASENSYTSRVQKDHLTPHMQLLMSGLFAVLDNTDLPDNDYVMKCIMRVLAVLGKDVVPIMPSILPPLTSSLERVCRNPTNPHFNQYLFECLAVLVRSSCGTGEADTSSTTDAATTLHTISQFEGVLFPPFQMILASDISEFVPYIFQILAQLLNAKPAVGGSIGGLSENYKILLQPLLSPVLWERKGNVPALTDLIRAYVKLSSAEIIAGGYLQGILGIFTNLLKEESTEFILF